MIKLKIVTKWKLWNLNWKRKPRYITAVALQLQVANIGLWFLVLATISIKVLLENIETQPIGKVEIEEKYWSEENFHFCNVTTWSCEHSSLLPIFPSHLQSERNTISWITKYKTGSVNTTSQLKGKFSCSGQNTTVHQNNPQLTWQQHALQESYGYNGAAAAFITFMHGEDSCRVEAAVRPLGPHRLYNLNRYIQREWISL